MSQSELLIFVLDQLSMLRIPYMVTGSVVSSLQGEPRATHDIDIVIVLEQSAIQRFSQLFSPLFYVSEASIQDAIDRKSMFNVIDGGTGNKVDFWMLTNDPFDQSRFARRQRIDVLGLANFYVTSPEDTILSKLRWAKLAGGSEKQITDVVHVVDMQFDRLDMEYISQWIKELSLQQQWQQVISRADPY